MAIKSFCLRLDEKMLDKLHFIADYEGRSANGQIMVLVRDAIEQYEKIHGIQNRLMGERKILLLGGGFGCPKTRYAHFREP